MEKIAAKYIKISIIIPSFNQGKYLEKTLLSVINQNYQNVEIILMDGGSTDNSLEIIKRYESHLFYWTSKKDEGQSNAINAGFRLATGRFKTWLNSDDVLLPNSLHNLNSYVQKNSECRWFLGNLLWIDKDDKILRAGKAKPYNKYFVNKGLFTSGGPSSFMRDDLLEEFGLLREDFHFMMDTEMWRRLAYHKEPFIRMENYVWALRLHEEAKMSGHNFKNSKLANKSHPSWLQQNKEREIMTGSYNFNQTRFDITINKITKIFSKTFITRVINNKYIGKHYTDILKKY